MENKEYLTVSEISKIHAVTSRNVRRIINIISNDTNTNLIGKDNNGNWCVHRLLLPKFKPQRIRKQKYYALSIDPCRNYTLNDLEKIMKFIVDCSLDPEIELNYSIEKKKENNRNHVHCYVKCNKRTNLIQTIKIAFSQVSYHQSEIFNLKGWENYITKDGTSITTLKKEKL